MAIVRPPSSDGDGYDVKDLEIAKDATETTTSSKPGSLRVGESEGGVIVAGGNLDSYRPIDEYEGAHRFDPSYQWTENEEKRLVRRVCSFPPRNDYVSELLEADLDWMCSWT